MRFRLRAAFAEEPLPPVALQDGKVADEPAFSVHAELLEHHGICLAFAMVEPIHVNVRRNRLDLRGLPVGPWLKPLKAAVHDGRDDLRRRSRSRTAQARRSGSCATWSV